MSGLNKVMLIGNLGADPEMRATPSGTMVANFRVAVNDTWVDKAGQKQERTEWMRIVAWGKLGEVCAQHLQKGRQVYVEGRLQTREWTDKENRKQYMTEVVAQQVVFVGSRGAGAAAGPAGANDDWQPPPDPFAESAAPGAASRERSRGDGSQMQAHRGAPAEMDIPF